MSGTSLQHQTGRAKDPAAPLGLPASSPQLPAPKSQLPASSSQPPVPRLKANIRIIEYTHIVQSQLRTFKAELFQALAHPTRIAIVESLRNGEVGAGALLAELGIEQANLSQHLAVLRAKHVVVARKAGNQVHYSLRDPVLTEVLDRLKQYFHAHLNETAALLGELDADREPAS
jgi:DNA-binding transcriptional ArsR family regulator